jgi:hypothetical protein
MAEMVTVFVEPRFGLWLHSLVLVSLILHGSMARHVQERRFLLALGLAPLIRLLSMATPLKALPRIDAYLTVGMLLAVATFLLMRETGLRGNRVGLSLRGWPVQLMLAPLGFGLGLMEYLILRPDPLVATLSFRSVWFPSVVLLVFTGFLEELIFRGVLQGAAVERLGRAGILYVAVLFTVMHLGNRSAMDLVFVFFVGLAFSVIVLRSRSILGVSLVHGLTNVGLYLLFPLMR